MQRIWNTTFPLAYYRHGVHAIAAQPHLHGLTFGPRNNVYFDEAWIDQ